MGQKDGRWRLGREVEVAFGDKKHQRRLGRGFGGAKGGVAGVVESQFGQGKEVETGEAGVGGDNQGGEVAGGKCKFEVSDRVVGVDFTKV